jgi:subtilisin family serine protease
MARRKQSDGTQGQDGQKRNGHGKNGHGGDGHRQLGPGGGTGRFLVLMRDEDGGAAAKLLSDRVGLRVARSSDFKASATPSEVAGAEGVVYEELGVAVVDADPEQYESLAAAETAGSAVAVVEPERIVYALPANGLSREVIRVEQPGLYPAAPPLAPIQVAPPAALPVDVPSSQGISRDYLEGLRDAIDGLLQRLGGEAPDLRGLRETLTGSRAITETAATWGLQLTRVTRATASGMGVRLAVLDTGMDTGHPDFAGRTVTTHSFIPGEAVQDLHGHGTHCIGTSCGTQAPPAPPRYGIAHGAHIFAGKVLSNQGSGADGGILGGINWAVANRCRIVSMSLGAPVAVGGSYSRVFETAARRALARGTLIIAAAGNESERPGLIAPVGHPANCPSIMAVAAIDVALRIAPFSCGDRNGGGGQVDLAGPGVNVYSTWPMPVRYRRLSGTSMATPHVAGIAALHAQVNPGASASDLWRYLVQTARRLPLPASDVGAGLVQAP